MDAHSDIQTAAGEARADASARNSPLASVHARLGAEMTARDGALVPAHYGDPRAEYDAVRGAGGAGLIDLSARGRVVVSGAEAVQFLNGLVTNDVKALADGAWMPAAFPNVQGRLLALARVARRGDSFHFDTEPATHAAVYKSLERFTLAGDFRVRDVTEETATLSVQGAGAEGIVGAAFGAEAARLERGRVADARADGAGGFLIRATHTAEDGFDLFCGAADAEKFWETLAAAGARPVGFEALEVLRVEAGVARYGVDVDETNVVLEAVPAEAVSFTKGCYVGQEIIARIHWRGHVAKRLTGMLLASNEPAPPGSRVRAAGREVGRVTSSALSPRLGRAIALGVVKYDFLAPGTEVEVVEGEGEGASVAARVAELPLVRGSWREGEEGAGGAA
jgi:folate-binding protein YgfZ